MSRTKGETPKVKKRFKVRLTRDTTESVDVVVEAESQDQANENALQLAGKYGERLDGWTPDDQTCSEPYLPDEGDTEETDDELTVAEGPELVTCAYCDFPIQSDEIAESTPQGSMHGDCSVAHRQECPDEY